MSEVSSDSQQKLIAVIQVSNMAGSGGGELRAPIFNGENFDFWQIKMKTIFHSYELWNMVESGYRAPTKEEELREAERMWSRMLEHWVLFKVSFQIKFS
ncbi:hypothetical protein PS2_013034 [Malus domestica]